MSTQPTKFLFNLVVSYSPRLVALEGGTGRSNKIDLPSLPERAFYNVALWATSLRAAMASIKREYDGVPVVVFPDPRFHPDNSHSN